MDETRSCFKFDPALCPLLQGLPPEEQQLLMQTDPMIRACIEMHTTQPVDPAAAAAGSCCQAIEQQELPAEPLPNPMIKINKRAVSA